MCCCVCSREEKLKAGGLSEEATSSTVPTSITAVGKPQDTVVTTSRDSHDVYIDRDLPPSTPVAPSLNVPIVTHSSRVGKVQQLYDEENATVARVSIHAYLLLYACLYMYIAVSICMLPVPVHELHMYLATLFPCIYNLSSNKTLPRLEYRRSNGKYSIPGSLKSRMSLCMRLEGLCMTKLK